MLALFCTESQPAPKAISKDNVYLNDESYPEITNPKVWYWSKFSRNPDFPNVRVMSVNLIDVRNSFVYL